MDPSPTPTPSAEPFPASRILAEGSLREGGTFWRDAFSWRNNIAPLVAGRVLIFGIYAFLVSLAHRHFGWESAELGVVEVTGAFLALMLVLRTNAGYNRWWEARILWGGIVNQSRNLAVTGLGYGPRDPAWRDRFARWTASFAHVARCTLRAECAREQLVALVGSEEAARVEAAAHRPSCVSQEIAGLLREALDRGEMGPSAFRQADFQRAQVLDHVGSCERILRTRFPGVHRIMLGQLIVAYLLAFPFAVAREGYWQESLLTMAVAFPLFALDQVARELGNPFSRFNRSHLPLDELSAGIQETVLALRAAQEGIDHRRPPRPTTATPAPGKD